MLDAAQGAFTAGMQVAAAASAVLLAGLAALVVVATSSFQPHTFPRAERRPQGSVERTHCVRFLRPERPSRARRGRPRRPAPRKGMTDVGGAADGCDDWPARATAPAGTTERTD